MSAPVFSSKRKRALAGAAAASYAAGLVALLVFGIANWRLYCEGFGCIGKGIAWFAWSIGFALVLLVGYGARRSYDGPGHRFIRYSWALQWVCGFALILYWVAWRAA
jgi:hypothetical protein